jgi:hypothetical protein
MILNSAVVADMLGALPRALDANAAAPGKMLVYTLPIPLAGQSAAAVLLGELVFDKPALDNVAGKVMSLKNPSPTLVLATGEASWIRLVDGGGQWVGDEVEIGLPDSLAKVRIDNGKTPKSLMLFAGGTLSVALAKWALP